MILIAQQFITLLPYQQHSIQLTSTGANTPDILASCTSACTKKFLYNSGRIEVRTPGCFTLPIHVYFNADHQMFLT